MTETLEHWNSSESTQRELCNEYQRDRIWMVFKNLCVFMFWMKVSSAIEGLINIVIIFGAYTWSTQIRFFFIEIMKWQINDNICNAHIAIHMLYIFFIDCKHMLQKNYNKRQIFIIIKKRKTLVTY